MLYRQGVLLDLTQRVLTNTLRLPAGDGTFDFWVGLHEGYPRTKEQHR